jgi:hemoglobin-like flavoprotein
LRGILTNKILGLGSDWTPEVKHAWEWVYGVLANTMIKGAEKASQKKSDEISEETQKEYFKIVQDTWKMVEPIRLQAADIFYEKMFSTNENVAKLFSKTNMTEQKDKLTKSIGFAVGKLDDLASLVPVLEQMGVKYVNSFFGNFLLFFLEEI